ncbi:MAG: hypothetical protein ACRCXT_19640 [Paraclostridium sp.]
MTETVSEGVKNTIEHKSFSNGLNKRVVYGITRGARDHARHFLAEHDENALAVQNIRVQRYISTYRRIPKAAGLKKIKGIKF